MALASIDGLLTTGLLERSSFWCLTQQYPKQGQHDKIEVTQVCLFRPIEQGKQVVQVRVSTDKAGFCRFLWKETFFGRNYQHHPAILLTRVEHEGDFAKEEKFGCK